MASAPNPNVRTPAESAPWQLGFWSLIVTQFQNAFNDNAVKFLVIYIIVSMNFPNEIREKLIFVVGALFAVPFILFSMLGGNFADRYSKRTVVIGTKLMEIGVMAVTIVGLYLHNLPIECAGVFLISSQSALFGPSKYGLLPELVPDRKLSWANGIIELGTFLGSIAATVAAGYLVVTFRGEEYKGGFILLGCTLFGLATSFFISKVPAADPSKELKLNPLGDLIIQMRTIRADRVLAWAVAGNAYFFFLAAFLQFTIIIYGHDALRVDDAHISYLQAAVAVGIGLGSVAAGYLSGGKNRSRPDSARRRRHDHLWRLALPLRSIHVERLYAARPAWILRRILRRPDQRVDPTSPQAFDKGGVIAAANFWSFIGIFIAAGAYYVFSALFHHTAGGIFLDGAVLTAIMTAFSIYLVPDTMIRLALWIITHTLYRLRAVNRDNVPKTRRRAVRRESHVVDRRAAVARLHRSPDSLSDVQRHLRPALHQAAGENGQRDSDFFAAAPARHDSFPARRE